jgi:hypothetical protein
MQEIPASLPAFEGGNSLSFRRRINAHQRDADQIAILIGQALDRASVEADFRLPGQSISSRQMAFKTLKDRELSSMDIRIVEHKFTGRSDEEPTIFYSVVEIEFWKEKSPAYEKAAPLVSSRGNNQCHPMRKETFYRLGERLPGSKSLRSQRDESSAPDVYENHFPIDVVYTWVDDKDPVWRQKKNDAMGHLAVNYESGNGRAHHRVRFANRDELLFSLRSLELFAPFVRHIFLVTADQRPSWLVDEHPRLTVLSHQDIYRDASFLPTFNSSSIETQLHHIEGLSEHFLYMNDDFFFGGVCGPENFFHSNGVAKLPFSDSRVQPYNIYPDSEEYIVADKNAIELFGRYLDFSAAPLLVHSPYPARVSILQEMEELFSEQFQMCARARFRSQNDVRPIAFMFPHYAYWKGIAVPSTIKNRYLALWKPNIRAQLDAVLNSRRYKTFCINDVGVKDESRGNVDQLVSRFLEDYFPYKSSFER